MNESGRIKLGTMKGLEEAVDMNDVWTGRTGRAERRRIQNRLNQRAFKKRKAAEMEQQQRISSSLITPEHVPSYRHSQHVQIVTMINSPESVRDETTTYTRFPYVKFPLSTDHLLTLVQYNVMRAMMMNFKILSIVDDFDENCHLLYNSIQIQYPLPDVPPTFEFTLLQRTVPHDSWIDTIPCSRLRDNLITACQQGRLKPEELCKDIVGGWCEGRNDVELVGMIAWSHTWSPCGWEVTEGFLRKWGYLLTGCRAMLNSTNKYRAYRGEEALVWEV